MPEWMTRDYVEEVKSVEFEGEGDTSAMDDQGKLKQDNGVPGMVSVIVRDHSIRVAKDDQQQQQQETSDQNAMSWSTMEESTTSIIQDYSSTNYLKNFSILDYVDQTRTATASNVNQNTNIVPSSETVQMDAAILEQKAAVLKQIRQKVNESAEKMPPAFTSTPRVNPDAVSSEDSSEDMLARRQRQGADGSVDVLPPVGDTNF